jgi:hypothetical protein
MVLNSRLPEDFPLGSLFNQKAFIMKKSKFIVVLFAFLISLSSCAELSETEHVISKLPASFTSGNIMRVHQGMTANEILRMFGEPKSIATNVCGRAPRQWNCTTWEYGEFPYEYANFTFSGKSNSLVLNNFDISRL